MQEHAQRLGTGIDQSGGVAGLLLQSKHVGIDGVPPPRQRERHAHAVDHFGIAKRNLSALIALGRSGVRALQFLRRQGMIGERERGEDRRTSDGEEPEQRVQEKNEGEIDWHPWRIEQRHDPRAAKIGSNGGKIAQSLGAVGQSAQRVFDRTPEQRGRQHAIDPHSKSHQDARPQHIQRSHCGQRAPGNQRQIDERLDAAAGQHSVIDLQHVHGDRQHQQVHRHAERADSNQTFAAPIKNA